MLGEDQSLIFFWEADGEVVFDFHSEEEALIQKMLLLLTLAGAL